MASSDAAEKSAEKILPLEVEEEKKKKKKKFQFYDSFSAQIFTV